MLEPLSERATRFRLVMTGFFVLILLHKLSHAYLLSSYQANAKKAIPYGSDFSLVAKLLLCDVFFQTQQSYLSDRHRYEGDCPEVY